MPLYDGYIEILLVIAVKAARGAKYETFGVPLTLTFSALAPTSPG
jgi:hypothetical protein